MAAEPIPRPGFASQVSVAADGKVTGQVKIENDKQVKFHVDYPAGYDTCVVTITKANISWEKSAVLGQNTIKVGN